MFIFFNRPTHTLQAFSKKIFFTLKSEVVFEYDMTILFFRTDTLETCMGIG